MTIFKSLAAFSLVFLPIEFAQAGPNDCAQSLTTTEPRNPKAAVEPAVFSQSEYTKLHKYWREHIHENYPAPMVSVAYLTLSRFMSKEPIAFYEYVQLCRNPDHPLFGKSGEAIAKYPELVDNQNGKYVALRHFKELTLALVSDGDLDMALLPPPPRK